MENKALNKEQGGVLRKRSSENMQQIALQLY